MTKKISFFVLSFLFALFLPLNIIATTYSAEPTPDPQTEITTANFCNLTPSGAPTGDVVLSNDCVVYENINGVANGNLTITSTITLHHDLVFYPNYQINIQGVVFINTGSKIQQGKICIKDADADGYADLISITKDASTGAEVTGSVFTQIQSEVVVDSPYTCSEGFVSRENFSNLALVDSGTNPDVYATGDNIFLQLGFEINGVRDLNAAAGDIILPNTKNLILLPGGIGGKIGIGTTIPYQKLEINGDAFINNTGLSFSTLYLGPDESFIQSDGSNLNFRLGSGSGGYNFFDASNTSRLYIQDYTGNVGIGTTSPESRLSIGNVGSPDYSVYVNTGADNGIYSTGINVGIQGETIEGGSGVYGINQNNGYGVNGYSLSGTGGYFTSNSGYALITGTGNVGVGLTNPGSKLHIASPTAPASTVRIGSWANILSYNGTYLTHNTTLNAGGSLAINAAGSGTSYINLGSNSANNGFISFATGAVSTVPTEYMRLTSDGRLGIGTTSPSTSLNVSTTTANDGITLGNGTTWTRQISGTVATGGYNPIVTSGDNGIIYSGGTAGSGSFIIAPWSTTISGIKINSSGNVGIGTTNPLSLLNIKGTTDVSLTTHGLAVFGDPTTDNIGIDQNEIMARSNGALSALFLNQEGGNVIINGSNGVGNVGIGTNTANARLSIGNYVATGYLDTYAEYQILLFNGTTALNSYGLGIKSNTIVFNSGGGGFSFDKAGASSLMVIDTAGNVGINTTAPTYKLQVVGTFYAGGSSREYKENIIPLTLDSSRIYELEPKTYDYKDKYKDLGKKLSGGRQFGLIAEDVYKIYPELTLSDGVKNVANVDYEKLGVLLLAEMKNQKKEIDSLKAKNIELEKRIEKIEQLLK